MMLVVDQGGLAVPSTEGQVGVVRGQGVVGVVMRGLVPTTW